MFAAATLVPMAVLSWLGFKVLEQDRVAERQRRLDALEVSAQRLAVDLERWLQEVASRPGRGQTVQLLPTGLVAPPDARLLYQPFVPPTPPVPALPFREAEAAEHQRHDFRAAARAYAAVAESRDPHVRAQALLGLSRVLRKSGNRAAALDTLSRLEALGSVSVADQPAALVAKHARARLFEDAGDGLRLREEAAALAQSLADGWDIDRATFDTFRDLIVQWGGPPIEPAAAARTDAAVRLWQTWRAGELPPAGRRVLTSDRDGVLAVWTGGPAQPLAWFLTTTELETHLSSLPAARGLHVGARDSEGRHLFGTTRPGQIALMPSDTRLPFVLDIAPAGSPVDGTGLGRRVLIGTLSLAFLLMIAAAYGLYRATTRELDLARQQREFVSAVSHEFRTPLTSLRHLTDLLATRGIESEERRAHYYDLLAHETERLHRMVENLLSFGRIEAGGYAWRLEPIDVGSLVAGIVSEFRRETAAADRDVTCDVEPDTPAVRADADALTRAVWNLLENAAKYSSPGSPIHVFARRAGTMVEIGVDDHGVGIQPQEQERVFQTFVRGADATLNGVRGVGIGLALVKRIVEAHGGSVKVESEPGRGSTFTLVIPCLAS